MAAVTLKGTTKHRGSLSSAQIRGPTKCYVTADDTNRGKKTAHNSPSQLVPLHQPSKASALEDCPAVPTACTVRLMPGCMIQAQPRLHRLGAMHTTATYNGSGQQQLPTEQQHRLPCTPEAAIVHMVDAAQRLQGNNFPTQKATYATSRLPGYHPTAIHIPQT